MAHQDRIYYFNELRGGGNTFAKGLRRSMRIYPIEGPFFKLLNRERIEKIRADLKNAYAFILNREFVGQYHDGLTLKQIKKSEDYKEMVDIVEQIIEFAFREGMTEEEIVDELKDVEKFAVFKEKSERYRPQREIELREMAMRERERKEKDELYLEEYRAYQEYLNDLSQERYEAIEDLLDRGERGEVSPKDNSLRPRFTTETNIPD